MSVELRHLRALVAVGDSDTITTAATVLGVTQPTLSRTIAQLEELVGVRLVDRSTQHLGLTDHGRRLHGDAVALIAQLDSALARLHPEDASPLRLGWAWAGLGPHTVPLLRGWRAEYTAPVEITRPDDPEASLLDASLDAAIVRRVLPEEITLPDMTTVHLYTEELMAAVPSTEHALVERDALTLADLAAHPVALCATAATVTAELWGGDTPPETITVANTDEWLTRIAMGDAVGVTAAATTYGHTHPGVTYLPVRDPARVEVSLMWPTLREHPAVEDFASFARRYFRALVERSSPPVALAL